MMTSVSPAWRALITRSRSPMTTTSAMAGLATETRVTGTGDWIGNDRPAGSGIRTMSCSDVCAAAGATMTTRSPAAITAPDASRRKPRIKPFKRSCSGRRVLCEWDYDGPERSVLRLGLRLLELLPLHVGAAEDGHGE